MSIHLPSIRPLTQYSIQRRVCPNCSQLSSISDLFNLSHNLRVKWFKCLSTAAKRSFYRAANAVFDKIGGRSSEDVILQLIRSKCLLYGLEACPLHLSDYNFLDFVVNRFFLWNCLKRITWKLLLIVSHNLTLTCLALFWNKEVMLLCVDISCVTKFLCCCTKRCLGVYCVFYFSIIWWWMKLYAMCRLIVISS